MGNVATRVGVLGADGAGKTTLTAAMLVREAETGQASFYCPSGDLGPVGMAHAKEIIRLVLLMGGNVDLGCDPGMTREGKELEAHVRACQAQVQK